MIIDSHAHVVLPSDNHLSLMNEAGVNKTILFSTSIHPENASRLNEYEVELDTLYKIISGKVNSIDSKISAIEEQCRIIDQHPSKFYGFGTVPVGLDYKDTSSWIEKYVVKNKFIGLGEFTLPPGQIKLLDSVFQASTNFKNLPIWIHAFWPLTLDDIKEIFILAKKYPNVPTIIGHLGGTNWLEVIKMAKETSNVYIDLSATFTMVALKMAIQELPEKTLFSSDLPYGDLVSSRFTIERACKNDAIKKQVLGGNIATLLKL